MAKNCFIQNTSNEKGGEIIGDLPTLDLEIFDEISQENIQIFDPRLFL